MNAATPLTVLAFAVLPLVGSAGCGSELGSPENGIGELAVPS
jgi:hypothetical protein